MVSLLAFLVLVGVLVWFHELGHFIMARLFGVRVEVFSIGFGPPVFAKRVGETVFQVALVPLGGFVKLYGEEEAIDDPRAFSAKKPWQKILIALGGPLFNFLLAWILFSVVYAVGVEVPKHLKEPVVVAYVEEGSWADRVGLKPGDRVVRVNGFKVSSWEELREALIKLRVEGVKETELWVKRGDKLVKLKVPLPDLEREPLGIAPPLPPVVGRVLPGSPADQVGIRPGDVILEVNGKPVKTWYELVKVIRQSKGKRLVLKIKRGDKVLVKEVVPATDPRTGLPVLGIAPKVETVKERYPLPEALKKGFERVKELTLLTLKLLVGLFTGEVSFKTIGGPIAIAQFAGQAAESGFIPFLSTMAFISLQLAIFNLLPLPVLDGGLILLFTLEWIRGRPLPESFKEKWQKVGFLIILTLMVLVIINDLLRVLRGG
ncbi:MAG: RIP metalloprotease RseP [Aquificae bacterium]|nr:RIP metalloprotease RseP [Aquificota bacterium]